MDILEIILLLIVAGIIGGIGQALAGFSRGGCLVSIVIGFIGAYIGPFIAKKFGLPDLFVLNIGGIQFLIIWSIIGALLFTIILSLISPRRN